MRASRAVFALILPLLACGPASGAGGAGEAGVTWSPLAVRSTDASGGASLSEVRVSDSAARRTIEEVELVVERLPDPPVAMALEVEIAPRVGEVTTARRPAAAARPGDRLRIPVHREVTREMEGAFTFTLRAISAGGEVLFEGVYGYGFPRYSAVRSMELARSGSVIRDDFEESAIDEGRWRIWTDNPDRAHLSLRGGRLVIEASGPVGYDGLVSHASLPTRDVELVCAAGVTSSPAGQHPALVHLCGNGDLSPDNWFEVSLLDGGEGETIASTMVSVPPRWKPDRFEKVHLARPSGEGTLVKIISDPSARLVRGLVRTTEGWIQVGKALEIPARESRLEIKTVGYRRDLGTSTVWFDDCRVYPRPETHYVTIKIQRPGGGTPGVSVDRDGWPLYLFDSSNEPLGNEEILLRLYASDGVTLVDETHPAEDLRFAVFTLDGAPWETYPAGAVIRIYAGGSQLGGDLPIRASGVDGLYPDDVYLVTLE